MKRTTSKSRGMILAFLVAGLLIVATITVVNMVRSNQQVSAHADFVSDSEHFVHRLEESVVSIVNLSNVFEGLFIGSELVQRQEFRATYEALRDELFSQGLLAIAYAQRVSASELAAYDAAHAFNVHPADQRAEYVPITYIEPEEYYGYLLGVDYLADPVRGPTIIQARDSGQRVLTEPTPLLTINNEVGYVVTVPLYAKGKPLTTLDERRAAFTGALIAGISLPDLFASVIGSVPSSAGLNITIYDGSVSPETTIYKRLVSTADTDLLLTHEQRINVLGRTWIIQLEESVDSRLTRAQEFLPLALLVAGIAFTGAVFLVLLLLIRSRIRAERMAQAMVAEVEKGTARTRKLFEELPDPAVVIDSLGRVAFANQALLDLVGFTLPELQERFFEALGIITARSLPTVTKHFAMSMRGKEYPPYEADIRLKGGEEHTFEISASPLVGFLPSRAVLLVLRDIHERKQREQHLKQSRQELEETNRFMTGREITMEHLKKEITELKDKLRD